MITKKPTRAKKIFARTCIAICVGIVAFPAIAKWVKNRPVDYDYDASIAKLKKIGAALQLYRAEYGVKPVAERRNYSDAGLPPPHSDFWPGDSPNSYGLNGDDFKVQVPSRIFRQALYHFRFAYWEDGRPNLPPMSQHFSNAGEMLPIMIDENMVSEGARPSSNPTNVIVLRLNGHVEVVSTVVNDQYDIWRE